MWKSPDEQKGNVSLNVLSESEPVEMMNDMNMPEVRP
jgi:hypothetical protein